MTKTRNRFSFKYLTGLLAIVFLFHQGLLFAGVTQPPPPPEGPADAVTDSIIINSDEPIVAMLDSLATQSVFSAIDRRSDTTLLRRHNFPAGFVPAFSDSVYQHRMEILNARSPFGFVYNATVKSFINLYANNRRVLTERMMGLGELYFPLFEEQLDRHNIPLEMKYLAVVESALNPTARSRVGATGLWQFMYYTGRTYGLEVNSYVDDRSDPLLATIAACEFLNDLYDIYGDWSLVIAAYNAGPGNINRAIRRAGGVKDFWLIRHFLPRETRNYVPAFIAVTYVMEHADEHNLFAVPTLYTHLDVDTIMVKQEVSLRNISQLLDIPLDHLRHLNPAFRQNIIPYRADNPYALRLPNEYAGLFLANEDAIYNYRTPEQIRQEEMAARMAETTVHVVARGEVLGTIARRYGTTVREIQQLNNLRGTLIRQGQRLVVRAPAAPASPVRTTANVHVVRRGESLSFIANRYRISVNNILEWNNLGSTVIYPGQQLIIRPPESSASSN
jgi:membrane-bound lytic murein transglycosylase D